MGKDYTRFSVHVNPAITGNRFCVRYDMPQFMVDDWKARLLAAVDASGRSDREISRAAKLGVNAVNELRTTDKAPSVERVLRIAAEVGVSRSYLFLGREASSEEEEYLRLLANATPEERKAVALLLQRKRSEET